MRCGSFAAMIEKLTYTRQQADKSIICRKEVITKEQFIDLIQDGTVQILF